jgi:multicomponent Na+:H+ antiporter subunit F
MTLVTWAAEAASWMILAAGALALARAALGPGDADRAVALELVSVLAVAFAGARAIADGQAAFLDAGMAVGLSAFLGTLALARYISRRAPGAGGRS